MANVNINTANLSYYSVQNLQIPAEGPKAIPLTLDFSVAASYTLNLQNVEARTYISQVQSVYLDNSDNTASLTVSMPGTNQKITITPNRQGYFNVSCPNPVVMVFTSQGGVVVQVQLFNFPQINHDWPTITGA